MVGQFRWHTYRSVDHMLLIMLRIELINTDTYLDTTDYLIDHMSKSELPEFRLLRKKGAP